MDTLNYMEGIIVIKICPKCGSVVHYDSYFQTYICSSIKCCWVEKDKTQRVYRKEKRYNGSRLLEVK